MLAVTDVKDVFTSLTLLLAGGAYLGVWVFGLIVAWRVMRALENIASALEARGPNKT